MSSTSRGQSSRWTLIGSVLLLILIFISQNASVTASVATPQYSTMETIDQIIRDNPNEADAFEKFKSDLSEAKNNGQRGLQFFNIFSSEFFLRQFLKCFTLGTRDGIFFSGRDEAGFIEVYYPLSLFLGSTIDTDRLFTLISRMPRLRRGGENANPSQLVILISGLLFLGQLRQCDTCLTGITECSELGLICYPTLNMPYYTCATLEEIGYD